MPKITLCIENFCFETIIGLLEKERNIPQKVRIDAKITIDYDKKKLVDYVVLSNTIEKTMKEKEFFTVEEALLFTCKKLKKEFKNIKKINLKILKTDILKNAIVGAKIKI